MLARHRRKLRGKLPDEAGIGRRRRPRRRSLPGLGRGKAFERVLTLEWDVHRLETAKGLGIVQAFGEARGRHHRPVTTLVMDFADQGAEMAGDRR